MNTKTRDESALLEALAALLEEMLDDTSDSHTADFERMARRTIEEARQLFKTA